MTGTGVESPRYRWKVLASVVFGVFMIVLDATVVNIAFRALQLDLHADVDASQWVISIYVLFLGVSTPASGYLGGRYGLKRVFLMGLALFTVASLLCGLAPDLPTLIAARALQGIGGGIAAPLGTAMLFAAFPPREQGLALGIFGVAVVSAPAIGPLIGGALVDLGHWRWIFFVNGPIGALGLALGSRWLRESRPGRHESLDWPGLLTSTLGFGAILYAASIAASRGWTAPEVLGSFAVGAVALAAFVRTELRVPTPLLDLRLFRHRTFTNAVLVGWVAVLALFGAEFLMPLYLQVLRGHGAFDAGLVLLPLGVAAAVATPIAGRLYDRVGPRPLVVVGFSILAVNTWQFARLDFDTPLPFVAFLLALRGLALGLTVQTTLVAALGTVPKPALPRGSALVNATRRTFQSISVAVLATILSVTAGGSLGAGPHAADTTGRALCSPLPADPGVAAFCVNYLHGLERAYTVTFVAALVALALGALLPGWPGRWGGRSEPG
jgi:DHA2 family multidrug resistance protein